MKLLFICHGNICRSPMAEFVMKDLVQKAHCSNEFVIDSAAVSREEIGNGIHWGTKEILNKYHIPYTNHRARQITVQDAEFYDLILCMDQSNIRYALRIIGPKYAQKVKMLLDRNIADPWYTGDFESTYNDIMLGLNAFIEYLKDNNKL